MSKKKFVFRKYDNIGAADAIHDGKFLEDSFVDNGTLEVLRNQDSHLCIVLGRTGSGKTALLEKLGSLEERVIKISPEGLALTYISTKAVLRFYLEAGVNLESFYHLLWTHVFAVELIKNRYDITSEQDSNNFFSRIKHHFDRDKPKRDAIEYLRNHGESFWKDSEQQVEEITRTLEKNLLTNLEIKLPVIFGLNIMFNPGGSQKLTEEQKIEVLRHGQDVVNTVQIKKLSNIIEVLETDLLDDKQKKYYITIDRLDENWIHDEFRYGLIKALIDTVSTFNRKIKNVKIIIAIREDLLERVFRYTRSPSGYQEEKYRSLYMNLRWNEAELEELLDRRVNQLIKEQYTNQSVKLAEIFPDNINSVNKYPPLKYFFQRTLLRPRDAILFFNECLVAAEGKVKFTQATILQAELVYSEHRLRALADEWAGDYINFFELALFLKKYPSQFRFTYLRDNIEDDVLKFLTSRDVIQDRIYHLLMEKVDSPDLDSLVEEVLRILFRVGLVGIKPETSSNFLWSYLGQKLPTTNLDSGTTVVRIHPAFWRVLAIVPESKEGKG